MLVPRSPASGTSEITVDFEMVEIDSRPDSVHSSAAASHAIAGAQESPRGEEEAIQAALKASAEEEDARVAAEKEAWRRMATGSPEEQEVIQAALKASSSVVTPSAETIGKMAKEKNTKKNAEEKCKKKHNKKRKNSSADASRCFPAWLFRMFLMFLRCFPEWLFLIILPVMAMAELWKHACLLLLTQIAVPSPITSAFNCCIAGIKAPASVGARKKRRQQEEEATYTRRGQTAALASALCVSSVLSNAHCSNVVPKCTQFDYSLPCTYGGCEFSKDASGVLDRTGSCPTMTGELWLGSKGIKGLRDGVFSNMGACE
jgi:hypothetical protein